MHQANSDRHQAFNLALLESKAIALALKQEAAGYDSDAVETINEKSLVKRASDRQVEQSISNLLKYGVLFSSAIVLMGGIVYLMRYGAEPADYRFFQGEPSALCSPKGIVAAVSSGSCRGFIQLGLLLLIATPFARVVFSFLTFLQQRDFTYVILTALVLAGLIYSFIGAYV